MPNIQNDNPIKDWLAKIKSADRYFDLWWRKFRCEVGLEYYEGKQWAGMENYFKPGYNPYVTNLVFSTIEVKLPVYLFQEPIFTVSPKPLANYSNSELEYQKAQLREAAINTFVQDSDNVFAEEVELAILDSFFAFGMLEVGFDGNYINNPNADKPYTTDSGKPIRDLQGNDVKQPLMVPEWEQCYVKRIHPKQFRVGGFDSPYLERCNWFGYYEFVDALDVFSNPKLDSQAKDEITYTGYHVEPVGTGLDYPDEFKRMVENEEIVKIYKIWDNRAKRFYIFTESNTKYLFVAPFREANLYPLKFSYRSRGFYPIPPVSQWLSPQDEINEAAEQLRVHRRRSNRKYLMRKGAVETEEMDKLMMGPDGTYGETDGDPATAVFPLPIAQLDPSTKESYLISKDNFNIVSGTSSEARGEADRTTATQATLINTRSQVREARPKQRIAKWLCNIAQAILINQSKITLPFFIKMTSKDEGALTEISDTKIIWEKITGEDIVGLDFEISINVSSMSPIDTIEDKNALLEFLAILTNYPTVSLSPTLIREIANKVGFKTNEQVIRELQQMATLAMMGIQAQAGAAMAQRGVGKTTPNDQERINNQLSNQVGLPQ